MEPMARAAYELAFTDGMVDQVGFAVHPTLDYSGASPDCLVGDLGMAEFKCPNTVTHLEYRLGGVVPEQYEPQMMWEMDCTQERKRWDFSGVTTVRIARSTFARRSPHLRGAAGIRPCPCQSAAGRGNEVQPGNRGRHRPSTRRHPQAAVRGVTGMTERTYQLAWSVILAGIFLWAMCGGI